MRLQFVANTAIIRCSHLIWTLTGRIHAAVDVESESAVSHVSRLNEYEDGSPEGQLIEFEVSYPTFPHEFVANCHLDELEGFDSGSAVVERVEIWHDLYHYATFYPPMDWTCETLIDEEVSQEIIDEHCGDDYEGDITDPLPEN